MRTFVKIFLRKRIHLSPKGESLLLSIMIKDAAPDKIAGGLLYKPDIVEEEFITGTVVAIGSGKIAADGSTVHLEISIGDKIVFNRHAPVKLKIKDQDYLVLREDQVLCILP